jgi:hypothetical protein
MHLCIWMERLLVVDIMIRSFQGLALQQMATMQIVVEVLTRQQRHIGVAIKVNMAAGIVS